MASFAFLVVLGCIVCAWLHGVQGQAAGLASSPFSKDPAAQEYIVQGVAGLCRDAQESFGLVDGPAASALFDEPSAAISVAPNAVLVADKRNGLIRRVAAGWVQTFSGSDLGYADGNRDLAPQHTRSRAAVPQNFSPSRVDTGMRPRVRRREQRKIPLALGGLGQPRRHLGSRP
jgi:hypothetical protein